MTLHHAALSWKFPDEKQKKQQQQKKNIIKAVLFDGQEI